MKIFAIGDLHLSLDPTVNKPMDVFGAGWENHHERLKYNWLKTVNNDDLVIIPGDVSWGLRLNEAMTDLNWINELPGKKVIFKGNHDLWWNSINKLNSLFDDISFIQNKCYYLDEEDIAICGTRGWISPGVEGFDAHDEKIYRRELMRLKFSLDDAQELGAKKIIVALHYPPSYDKSKDSLLIDLIKEYNVEYLIYGHLHGLYVYPKGLKGNHDDIEYRLVSLDYLNAKPLLIYNSKGGFNHESYSYSIR
ncbi:MAG TPA: metallophosphoesterase [Anaerovoracaceae bacterium]|nr:metallophosphoesterase [Anaerovoracaceae bacterium]